MHEIHYRKLETIWPVHHDQTPNWPLRENQIHVWPIRLDQSVYHIRKLSEILSLEERRRADRFQFKKDKRHFIICHGILRRILGNYLGILPHLLEFFYGPQGKPYIQDDLNTQKIQFNISHSREIGLFAFTFGREIGVDVEQIRGISDMDLIAKYSFSDRENAVFRALPDSQKTEVFFNCWVRKEAYIKAIGKDLSFPLDAVDVTLAPGVPAKLLSISGNEQEASRWEMHEIKPVAGYISAIVTRI